MKKNILLLIIIISFTKAFGQYDPKALAILEAMSKKYKDMGSFKANFTFTLESPESGINETTKGEIIVKGNKFFLMLGGQHIINNGNTVWTYIKDANEVNISDYDPNEDEVSPTKIYTMYKNGYKYIFLEEKTEEGKAVEVVDLIPEDKKNPFFKVRLEINKKDKTIKSWKIYEKNGTRYNYTVTAFTPDFKVEDNFFTFDKSKYKGVEIIDLR